MTHKKRLISLTVFVLLFPISFAFAQVDPIFWNRLGSETEIQNSEFGVNGQLTNPLSFAAVEHGDGVGLATGSAQVVYDNFFGNTFPDAGTIEFWWIPGRDENSSTGSHFDEREAISITSDELDSNNFPDSHFHIMQHSGNYLNTTRLSFGIQENAQFNINYDLDYLAGSKMHVAVTWDKALGASAIKLYIDGIEQTPSADNSFLPEQVIGDIQARYAQAGYTYDMEFHRRSKRPDGASQEVDTNTYIDNLKIYSCARTEFTDRFDANSTSGCALEVEPVAVPFAATIGVDPLIPTTDPGDYFMVDVTVGTAVRPASAFFGIGGELNWDPALFELVTLDDFDLRDNNAAINAAAAIDPNGTYDLQNGNLARGTYIAAGGFLTDDNTTPAIVFEDVSQIAAGAISFTAVRQAPAVAVAGSGVAARIAFRALDAAAIGLSSFTMSNLQLTDNVGVFIDHEAVDGPITIVDRLEVFPGDTDDNGEVALISPSDIFPIAMCFHVFTSQRFSQSITFAPKDARADAFPGGGDPCSNIVTPNPAFADANGSGQIDQNDILPIGVNLGRLQSEFPSTEAERGDDKQVRAPIALKRADQITVDIPPDGIVALDVVVKDGFLDRTVYGNWLMGFEGRFDLSQVPASAVVAIEHDASYFQQATLVLPALTSNTDGVLSFAFSATRDGTKSADGWGGVTPKAGTVARLIIAGLDAGGMLTTSISDLAAVPNGALPVVLADDAYTLVAGTVPVSVENLDETPDEYTLSQNYPNPFNPQTTIAYSLANAESVHLAVYDMLGRQVAVLVDGSQQTVGTYTVRFDASGLSSGIYFYQIIAGQFSKTGRMQLIK